MWPRKPTSFQTPLLPWVPGGVAAVAMGSCSEFGQWHFPPRPEPTETSLVGWNVPLPGLPRLSNACSLGTPATRISSLPLGLNWKRPCVLVELC
jgi:hypothetical protein